ncbi:MULTISPECIES: TetR/AcrR family transcriptional regulator [unclassified Clostridium]|uniref:TetR/AcrR family transcriptional regulator n=1 Tax=unclassified Clostridium TaxID=2614128 RepID=UPI0002979CA8|nr:MULTISPECIES: TetR/AcrR family transcriptional regulator [unclassified Clostridium]EKQ53565.1 MAG: transcriptional regulator [Clostridium sp. Maddingley MBC34-26]
MNNFEIRTNKKKSAIIDAAKELFRDKGFINVSIKEIASKANVSQVSIYNYFGSKDALVGECVSSLMNDIIEQARDILYSKMDFKEKLVRALSLCSDNLSSSFNEYFSREALKDSSLLKLLTESLTKEKLKLYKEYIDAGKEEGVIDKTLSTETILKLLEIILINYNDFNVSYCYLEEIQKIFFYGILIR